MTTQAVEDYEYEALPEDSSMSACLLAGAFAGIAEHAVMYPIDSIKVWPDLKLQRSSPPYWRTFFPLSFPT